MKTAYELIKKNNLLLPKEKIGVACSGGIDSMCLLHFLNTNKDLFGIQVFAINIDHSIREKSADDSKFVENFCKENNIKLYQFKIDCLTLSKDENNGAEK